MKKKVIIIISIIIVVICFILFILSRMFGGFMIEEGKNIDLEDMNSGISITDLGLNDFRMDLIEYVKNNDSLDKVPTGMH